MTRASGYAVQASAQTPIRIAKPVGGAATVLPAPSSGQQTFTGGLSALKEPEPAAPRKPMFRQHLADGMWYGGHVLGCGSLLNRLCLPAAAASIGVGQLLVIVSRPVGRVDTTCAAQAQRWADGMWYTGHVLACGSLLSHTCLPAAGALVGVGQLLTIVSRPIGRVGTRALPQPWGDCMWYAGHVLACGSLLSVCSLPAAATLVVVGQLAVIASRPIGRSGPQNAPESRASTPAAADDAA